MISSSFQWFPRKLDLCGFSDELKIYVHRYDQGERTCRCGRKSIDDPVFKNSIGFYGKRRTADPKTTGGSNA